MSEKVNYIQIRKLDASGSLINLNALDSVGDTLTFQEEVGRKSSWKILTLQEYPTYYLLGVEEDNYPDNGSLSNLYNSLFSGIQGTPPTLNNVPFPTQHPIEAVTGVGEGAKVQCGYANASGGGGTGAANVLRVLPASRGLRYQVGDQIKFTIPAADGTNPSGGDIDVNITLTADMVINATNEIVDVTNIPFYASFSLETTKYSQLGPNMASGILPRPIPDYGQNTNNTVGTSEFIVTSYQPMHFMNLTTGGGTNPQPFDSVYQIYPTITAPTAVSQSGYQFGLQPQCPVEFSLELKGLESNYNGHFYFNMFQYSDASGAGQKNVFSGRYDATAPYDLINHFRGFGLSSSINTNVGQTLTGPVYVTGTPDDFKISGSIRAGEIQSGSIWVIGVSKNPTDFAVNKPTLTWTEATWSMKLAPEAKAYQANQYSIGQIAAGNATHVSWSHQFFGTNETFGPEAYIDPYNNLWTSWANNSYNPIAGNFNESRENSFLMDIEYNSQTGSQVPSNRFQIISQSAQKANIPDSNYTQRRVIHPRYLGCRLQSADYNFYTEEGYLGEGDNFNFGFKFFSPRMKFTQAQAASNPVLDQFLNGDTCSIAPEYSYPTSSKATASKHWYGDISYGKNAVAARYPKYIAHFQQSHDSYLKFGTRQFDLDALIEIPNQDMTGEQGFQAIPIPLDGDGEYQFDVAKTFEAKRDAGVFFNTYITGGIDYSLIPGKKRRRKRRGRRRLAPKSGEIYDGGMKYTLMYTNEVGGAPEDTALENIEFAPSYSYRKNRARISLPQKNSTTTAGVDPGASTENDFTQSIQMITGSTEYGVQDNYFILSGSCFPVSGTLVDGIDDYSQVPPFARLPRKRRFTGGKLPEILPDITKSFYSLGGPQLAVLHTHNYYLYNNIKARAVGQIDLNRNRVLAFNPGVSAKRKRNYWKFLPKQSGAPGYEYDKEPFLIEPGDEIRVTAEVSTAGYEYHTGSVRGGINPYTYEYNNPAGYLWNSYFRSRGSGCGGTANTYYELGTETDGDGKGATVTVSICTGTCLGGQYLEGGWLGQIVDNYILHGGDYTLDMTNAGSGMVDATYSNKIATGGSGTGGGFNITVSSNVATKIEGCIPGSGYKNGDVLTWDVSQVGGAGTPPTITLGTKLGVGRKPHTKFGTDIVAANPNFSVDTVGNVAGSTNNIQFNMTFRGETGFKDASCTNLVLNRVGTDYSDTDYIIYYAENLQDFGAGLGIPVNDGIAGVTGSMLHYNQLIIQLGAGCTTTGPCQAYGGSVGGNGYKAGDKLIVPGEYISGSSEDLIFQLEPEDLMYQDSSKTTREFSFQVLAVSQSTHWSGSGVPTDVNCHIPFPGPTNNFGWCGLEQVDGSIITVSDISPFTDLISYVIDMPPQNAAAAGTTTDLTSVSTTTTDDPNGSGGSGLVVTVSQSNGLPTNVIPTTAGSGYNWGDIVRVNMPTGYDDFFIEIPVQAYAQYDCQHTGSTSHVGQFGGIADKIFVHPNPKQALYGIKEGEITRCTFRKRTYTDQAVTLEMDPPSGSLGVKTPSGDGYLIPSDLSRVQKRNALSVINTLNSQNAFRKNN